MVNKLPVILILLLLAGFTVFSQTDPSFKLNLAGKDTISTHQYRFRDSASLARWQLRKDSIQAYKDSIKAIGDSLSMVWIKYPDPRRPDQFIDSMVRVYSVINFDFNAWAGKFPKKISRLDAGRLRIKGETWVPASIILLLLFFAILKNTFSKEIGIIIQSFYSNRVLSQISKEDSLFSSWPFVFLYILFGFTIGMFLYLCGKYFQLTYAYDGPEWFIVLSLMVIGLFTLKIIVLRLLGFLFDVKRMVREYVSILYLSYFNAALVYLPLILAFSLTPLKYAHLYIYLAIILLGCIFFFQFLRAGANILGNYRFSKMYLFIYLCALEVCPLLILFKALRFSPF